MWWLNLLPMKLLLTTNATSRGLYVIADIDLDTGTYTAQRDISLTTVITSFRDALSRLETLHIHNTYTRPCRPQQLPVSPSLPSAATNPTSSPTHPPSPHPS